jgi:hypothetical protein
VPLAHIPPRFCAHLGRGSDGSFGDAVRANILWLERLFISLLLFLDFFVSLDRQTMLPQYKVDKRSQDIADVKNSAAYLSSARRPRPVTPDPRMYVSKRRWEQIKVVWRAELRRDSLMERAVVRFHTPPPPGTPWHRGPTLSPVAPPFVPGRVLNPLAPVFNPRLIPLTLLWLGGVPDEELPEAA